MAAVTLTGDFTFCPISPKGNFLETLIKVFENVLPNGFFWSSMKNLEISVLMANCQYLQMATLNCLFPLDVQNEIQLLSRVFCYSWLVCFLGFWLRKASLVKARKPISDGIVFVFHLAWCVWSNYSLTCQLSRAASPMVSLSNYSIWLFLIIYLI